jgi:O-antigen ligase
MIPQQLPGIRNPFTSINGWLLILVALAIPFPGKLPLPVLWLAALGWLAEIFYTAFKTKSLLHLPKRFVASGRWQISLSFFLLTIVYIIGAFYSSNAQSASFEIEKKSALLLIPLVLFTSEQSIFNRRWMVNVLLAFLLGMALVTGYYAASACIAYAATGDVSGFFYSRLSGGHHPGYLSFYAAFAIAISAWLLSVPLGKGARMLKIAIGSSILWWVVLIVLLSSKAGILSLMIVLVMATWFMFKTMQPKHRIMLLVGMIILAGVLGGVFSRTLHARFVAMRSITLTEAEMHAFRKPDGVMVRILSWKVAVGQIAESPWFGTGTGDYYDETRRILTEKSLIVPFGGVKNAHNQFLQTAVTVGVPGLVALLLWLFAPFLSTSPPRQWLYLVLVVLTAFNLCVESMLEVQAGIIMLAFFHAACYLCSGPDFNEKAGS